MISGFYQTDSKVHKVKNLFICEFRETSIYSNLNVFLHR